MEQELYDLHLQVGKLCGEDRTCGKKIKYDSEEFAGKASASLNKSKNKKHECEPYPCAFCEKWHIGGVMPIEKLRSFLSSEEAEK